MPGIGDYDAAFRAGGEHFKDELLKRASVETIKRQGRIGMREEPWRIAGAYAVVYKMRMADGRMRAVRCSLAEYAMHAYRYGALHAELRAKLKEYTVDFRYLEQGIRLERKANAPYLPIVDMEWVQGQELRHYVAALADHQDTKRIEQLGAAWLALTERMRVAQIAHGNLSGSNVMVHDDGSLVLIDYDGMYLPSLASERPSEIGGPDYQHPTARARWRYGPEMDRFSALLIYVALRALQERPALWRAHAEYAPTGELTADRMLFSAQDLRSPNTSTLFHELATLKDPLTLKVVATLKMACMDDSATAPWLNDAVTPPSTQPAPAAQPAPQPLKNTPAAATNQPQPVSVIQSAPQPKPTAPTTQSIQSTQAAQSTISTQPTQHLIPQQSAPISATTAPVAPTAAPKASIHVFIAYSSADSELVERLKDSLTRAGVKVWLDHEQLIPGAPNWQVAIRNGVSQATHVIYVASETAAISPYVIDEITLARDDGKPVIPFWARGEKWNKCAPLGWGLSQYVDGRGPAHDSGIAKLLKTLGL